MEKRISESLLTKHDHTGKGTRLERANCGACALQGYGEKKNGFPIAPNYSGWARIYIQAGKPIPKKYIQAFEQEKNSDNVLYAQALQADIIKYGLVYA